MKKLPDGSWYEEYTIEKGVNNNISAIGYKSGGGLVVIMRKKHGDKIPGRDQQYNKEAKVFCNMREQGAQHIVNMGLQYYWQWVKGAGATEANGYEAVGNDTEDISKIFERIAPRTPRH